MIILFQKEWAFLFQKEKSFSFQKGDAESADCLARKEYSALGYSQAMVSGPSCLKGSVPMGPLCAFAMDFVSYLAPTAEEEHSAEEGARS